MPDASWKPAALRNSIARAIPIRRVCWRAGRSSIAHRPSCRSLPAIQHGSTGRLRLDPATVIEVRDVTVSFGSGTHRIDAVRTVSFTVGAGETFGLVGESGCGKSTLLRTIAGLQPATAGVIALAEQAVGERRTRAERRLVQMVSQDPYGSLNPTHTVDRILAEPLAIQRLDNVDRRIDQSLCEVGMGPQHRFRYPHQISGGQRQRIAIAPALIMGPKILWLDEPTSALDLSVQAEILNLLKHVARDRGLTMLMVSHDLPVIAHMCNRIAVMRRGEIVETLHVDRLRRGDADHPYTRELLASSLEAKAPTQAKTAPSVDDAAP